MSSSEEHLLSVEDINKRYVRRLERMRKMKDSVERQWRSVFKISTIKLFFNSHLDRLTLDSMRDILEGKICDFTFVISRRIIKEAYTNLYSNIGHYIESDLHECMKIPELFEDLCNDTNAELAEHGWEICKLMYDDTASEKSQLKGFPLKCSFRRT